ncbi:putative aminoacyl-tRNA hydrolase [Helianthus annuus]|uniref:Aminoacyl-tRNA hydrolase n=1 Tax=Helianthus annuus TaxID=4232 RepID=A0A251RV31_HELAN|nr:putative aminoacyl-tRNA hydrolase [Helianthus annuus]
MAHLVLVLFCSVMLGWKGVLLRPKIDNETMKVCISGFLCVFFSFHLSFSNGIWVCIVLNYGNPTVLPVVGPFAAYYQVPLRHILLVYDKMSLPNGVLRLQPSGGHGYHNGDVH